MFIVTLSSQHAQCAYTGLPKRSMPAAYRSALSKASKQFLAYREAVKPRSDLDYQATWDATFNASRRMMALRPASMVDAGWVERGLHVTIRRVPGWRI
jgi:hypothetical protein